MVLVLPVVPGRKVNPQVTGAEEEQEPEVYPPYECKLLREFTGRTSGSLLLANGDAKQQGSCASDGYCAKDEKCCPSKCARRHICLKSLTKEDDDK
ncbi:hypothetical protein E2C01_011094 [Portunus trituberculatus]|uniref:WAP domain-containing protein n=1 Tax=Portunus trituberculatus TaxID=210409 RepID=A0A5B7DAT9_PORTR|nr:hypothetical protein [Portunus trituberculatus]